MFVYVSLWAAGTLGLLISPDFVPREEASAACEQLFEAREIAREAIQGQVSETMQNQPTVAPTERDIQEASNQGERLFQTFTDVVEANAAAQLDCMTVAEPE